MYTPFHNMVTADRTVYEPPTLNSHPNVVSTTASLMIGLSCSHTYDEITIAYSQAISLCNVVLCCVVLCRPNKHVTTYGGVASIWARK